MLLYKTLVTRASCPSTTRPCLTIDSPIVPHTAFGNEDRSICSGFVPADCSEMDTALDSTDHVQSPIKSTATAPIAACASPITELKFCIFPIKSGMQILSRGAFCCRFLVVRFLVRLSEPRLWRRKLNQAELSIGSIPPPLWLGGWPWHCTT